MAFDLDRYLARLQIARPSIDLAGLATLQEAHMRRIPFEGFEARLGRAPDLSPAALMAKLVESERGGWCFEHSLLMQAALAALGFTARRVMGRVRLMGDLDGPRSHLASVVTLDGRDWLVDPGFGGQGPMAPVALDGSAQPLPNGVFRVVADEDRGERVLEMETPEGWQQLYAFDDARVTDADIQAANLVCTRMNYSPFSARALAGSWRAGHFIGLADRSVTRRRDGAMEQGELADSHAFAAILAEMGLVLPEDDLAALWETTDPPA